MTWTRIDEYSPAMVGVNGACLPASTTGNWIHCKGANQISFDLTVVNVSAAALPVIWYMECRKDFDPTTTAHRIVMKHYTGAAGMYNIFDDGCTYTTPAVAATYRKTLNIPVTYDYIRFAAITAAGSGATDLVSIRARVLHDDPGGC